MTFKSIEIKNFNFTNFGNFNFLPMNFNFPIFSQMSLFTFQPKMPDFMGMFQWNMPINNALPFLPTFNNTNIKLPEIDLLHYSPTSYTPKTVTPAYTFDSNNFFNLSKTTQPYKASEISSVQNTTLKEVAEIYNQEKGIKLAKEAIAGLSSARKGYCAQAVKTAISDAGLGAYESGDAYEVPNILRRNNNFKEVKVKGSDLAKLPAGCVIAYAKGAAGYSSKYGHVEIKGEGNQAISFFVNNNIKPSDDVSVFVPV